MFDLSACNVERTASGDYRVHWRCAGADQKVDIYMADDPEAYYAGQLPESPLASASGGEAFIANPDPWHRHYFYLQSPRGEGVILAERWLDLEGLISQ